MATAMNTVPTGFASLPPPGPATPVVEIAIVAPVRVSAPRAISMAVSWLTAPCAAKVDSRTPRSATLRAFS